MSLNVRSGLGQVPTFVFIPAVARLALAAISPVVSTAKNTPVTVGNVPGLALGKFNPTAQNNQVIRVLNVPGRALSALIAVSNFKVHVNATRPGVALGGTGVVHGVVAVNTPAVQPPVWSTRPTRLRTPPERCRRVSPTTHR